jgi:hypothetical protein
MQPDNKTWNPGRVQDEPESKLFKINVPDSTYSLLRTAVVSTLDVTEETDMEESSRTELDSHANMPVVGKNAYIISDTGRVADVNPFTPDYDSMMIPIVDAAVLYECPYDGQLYILVIRNALHVPSMQNNLLPPFVLREAGIRVKDTPKIQTIEPTEEDHSIYFPETDFRIPLSLWGMFSYFVTSKPTALQMMESEDIYLLTPSIMNPHCDSYATNEENMLDWEGNMIERKDRVQILLSDIQEDVAMAASVQVSSAEANVIDTLLETSGAAYDEEAHPCWKPIPRAADEISSVLAGVSPTLDDQVLYRRLTEQADLGRFKASIGSTDASSEEYLVETVDNDSSTDDDMSASDSDEEEDLDELYERATQGKIDLDEIMVGAAHAGKPKGVDPTHLSKI